MDNQNTEQASGKLPLHRISGKGGLYLKVWENESPEYGAFLSTELGRSYKDDAGNWKVSRSYSPDQLNQIPSMITEAGMYIRSWQEQNRQLQAQQAPQNQLGLAQQQQQVMAQAVDPAPAQQPPSRSQSPEW